VAEAHELRVHSLTLIKQGTIAKTSSGKIQRGASRKGLLERTLEVVAEWQLGPGPEDEIAPASPPPLVQERGQVEEWLVSLLAGRLGVETPTLDRDKPLFAYGLDSLAAIELKHRIEAALGIELALTDYFGSAGIGELAETICEQMQRQPASRKETTPGPTAEACGEFPLSFGQQSLWFMHKVAPESAAYNVVFAARIPAALEVPALQRAFQLLVNRHGALRTSFLVREGKPVQRIREHAAVDFLQTDAVRWDDATLHESLVIEAHRPFKLEADALLRVNLFSRGEAEHVLLLVLHHIIADFWSLAILMHELGMVYRAEKRGEQVALPPLEKRYADYVRWQQETLSSAAGERLWPYWRSELEGTLAPLNLPLDKPRPPAQTYSGAALGFKLTPKLTAQLAALSRAQGATL
jgi:acyl carrier protein